MNPGQRAWVSLAALAGGLAVVLAALGAHALPVADPARFDAAWRVHALHAVALLAVAATWPAGHLTHGIAAGFTLGMLLFCGSLYVAAIDTGWPTTLAPAGGTILIVSWLVLAFAVWRRP